MADLCLADIKSFHLVCKRWRSIEFSGNRCRHMNQIPWLMISNCHRRLTSSCTLIDPSSKKIHSIEIKGINRFHDNIELCTTKFGWLLLSQLRIALLDVLLDNVNFYTAFFLYSPFIGHRIDLPNLNSTFNVATFSSAPTSPDCVFFVFTDKLTISICRQGDKAWTSISLSVGFSPIKDVVYSKGMFYCSTIRGGLGVFDVSQLSWSVLPEPNAIMDVPSFDYSSYMVGDEEEDQLLLVLVSNSRRWVLVHKLDRSEMKWVKVEELRDKSLFVSSGSTSIFVSFKNKRTEKVMNRIYYCMPSESPKFYSFKASKSFKASGIYGDLTANESPNKFFWIEPPY
ncbi:F-box/kelch-repeat protein At1g57790-like [Macadamia integrifolia]|uniref:F-box/kelch-repeat protein At1g57790-like n=1 Tax=Macadamia integrifolia TaxID=60698 RepID=UPI001C4F1C6C|nr:F-box/kelch-repeat protein At1g57790-like [Macadamia integrifolia]